MSYRLHQRVAGTGFALALLFLALLLSGTLAQAADTDLAKNKALVQAFWNEVLIGRNVDAASRYVRADFVQHDPLLPSGLKPFQDILRKDFAQRPADFKLEVTKLVAEGDLVVTYTQVSGKDPQGKPFTGAGFDMFRIEGGLIVEHWNQVD